MNNNEIEIAKNNYNNLLLEKEKLKKLKQEILELEQTDVIKKYLNLVKMKKTDERRLTDENMIYEAFSSVGHKTACSNEILIYMGAYKNNGKGLPKLVYEKDADYICYEDLETRKIYRIEPCEKNGFENSHKIIYIDNNIEEYSDHYLVGIRKLRYEFYKNLITLGQEEAVKKLVKEK